MTPFPQAFDVRELFQRRVIKSNPPTFRDALIALCTRLSVAVGFVVWKILMFVFTRAKVFESKVQPQNYWRDNDECQLRCCKEFVIPYTVYVTL